MPVYRERADYRQYIRQVKRQAPAPLTQREAEIIEHRQVQVIRSVRAVLTDASFQALADPASISTKGGLAYQRQLMFAKAAIFDEGRNLVRHWPTIKFELRIPWAIHYYNMALAAWKEVGGSLESGFFSSKTDDFDPTQLALYNGLWLPISRDADPRVRHRRDRRRTGVPRHHRRRGPARCAPRANVQRAQPQPRGHRRVDARADPARDERVRGVPGHVRRDHAGAGRLVDAQRGRAAHARAARGYVGRVPRRT